MMIARDKRDARKKKQKKKKHNRKDGKRISRLACVSMSVPQKNCVKECFALLNVRVCVHARFGVK